MLILAFLTIALAEVCVVATPVRDAPTKVQDERFSKRADNPFPIPSGALFETAHYPRGCGNGDAEILTGYQENLAVCMMTGSVWGDGEDSSIGFAFPKDGVVYKWKLFSSIDCSTQIYQGEGAGCFNVPIGQDIGAMIVYT